MAMTTPLPSRGDENRTPAPAEVVLPPAPPGESASEAVVKTQATAEILTQLGPDAEPRVVAEHAKRLGLTISPEEVATIREKLFRRATTPPGPDQPPPEAARGRADAGRRDAPAGGPARTVRDVMTCGIETVAPHSTLQDAAARMKARNVGALAVGEGGPLLGIVTDRDITVRAVAYGHDAFEDRVRDVMTPHVIACAEDQDVQGAARLMQEHQVRRLVVLDREGQPVGLLSVDDLASEAGAEHLAGETLKRVAEPAAPHRTPETA
jgi:CBS domain-containing protein